MENNRKFNKGDFLRYDNKPGSFAIFEGVDLMPSYQYTKKLSVVLFYDPSKYCANENGTDWSQKPFLEISDKNKFCEKTVDGYEENYFWKHCSPSEKEAAIAKLAEYGYKWNEETLELVSIATNKVVYKIVTPKLEYNGDIIKPISSDNKASLKNYVKAKNSYSSSPYYNYGSDYGGYYQTRGNYLDEYD